MHYRSQLTVPLQEDRFHPSIEYVLSYARQLGLEDSQIETIEGLLEIVFNKAFEKNRHFPLQENIQIELIEESEKLTIEVKNRGAPIYKEQVWASAGVSNPFADHVRKFRSSLSEFSFKNLGRNGQMLRFAVEIKRAPQIVPTEVIPVDEKFEYRLMRPGEGTELCRLFWSVYGYDYINEAVYYPERIEEMLKDGSLISHVAALPNGRLIGHVGLVRLNKDPVVFEAALGVVDPTLKSKGLFGELFKQSVETMTQIPMRYCVYDFVTNHDFSQRLVSRYGSREMALYIGNQVSRTQAKLEKLGIGTDPKDMNRYSLLVAVSPRVEHPFGKEIILPANMGEMSEFILKPLGVNWVPAPRFYPLPSEGRYTVKVQPEQLSAVIDFVEPGRKAVEALIQDFRHLLREGIQYVGVDVPLCYPGIGQLYDLLAKHGFFIAGFIPYHNSASLGFRLQFIVPTKVAFDQLKLSTETGQRLLRMVRSDYERNSIL